MKNNQRRHDMSEICYPDKITLEEFVEELREALDPFKANMIHLRKDDGKLGAFYNSEHYIEEWFEVFARWTEIMSEGFDPFITEERSDS